MGEILKSDKRTVFYSVLEGELIRNADEKTPHAELKTVKNPKTGLVKEKWVVVVRGLTGHIHSVEFKEHSFDGITIEKLVLKLRDDNEICQLEVIGDSSYGISLINRLATIAKHDLGKNFFIVGSYKIKDDNSERYNQGIWLKVGDKKVENCYSKELMPADTKWQEIVVNNKKVWDKTNYLRFFKKVAESEVIPYFKNLQIADTAENSDEDGTVF